MTFRAYVRWPDKRTTHKTNTDVREVADFAFQSLLAQADGFAAQGALGISFTHDGRQVEYRQFAEDPPR
jgi:hypothetical protein